MGMPVMCEVVFMMERVTVAEEGGMVRGVVVVAIGLFLVGEGVGVFMLEDGEVRGFKRYFMSMLEGQMIVTGYGWIE